MNSSVMIMIFIISQSLALPFTNTYTGDREMPIQFAQTVRDNIAIVNNGFAWGGNPLLQFLYETQVSENQGGEKNTPTLPPDWRPQWLKETHPFLFLNPEKNVAKKTKQKEEVPLPVEEKSTPTGKQITTEEIIPKENDSSEKPIAIDFENSSQVELTQEKKYNQSELAYEVEPLEGLQNFNQLSNSALTTNETVQAVETSTKNISLAGIETTSEGTSPIKSQGETSIVQLDYLLTSDDRSTGKENNFSEETVDKQLSQIEDLILLSSIGTITNITSPDVRDVQPSTETTIESYNQDILSELISSTEGNIVTKLPFNYSETSVIKPIIDLENTTVKDAEKKNFTEELNSTLEPLKEEGIIKLETTTERPAENITSNDSKKEFKNSTENSSVSDLKKLNEGLMEINYSDKTTTEKPNNGPPTGTSIIQTSTTEPSVTESTIQTNLDNQTEIYSTTSAPITVPTQITQKTTEILDKSTREGFTLIPELFTLTAVAAASPLKNKTNKSLSTAHAVSETTPSPEDISTTTKFTSTQLPDIIANVSELNDRTTTQNNEPVFMANTPLYEPENITKLILEPTSGSLFSNTTNGIENITETSYTTGIKHVISNKEDNKTSEAEKLPGKEKVIGEVGDAFTNSTILSDVTPTKSAVTKASELHVTRNSYQNKNSTNQPNQTINENSTEKITNTEVTFKKMLDIKGDSLLVTTPKLTTVTLKNASDSSGDYYYEYEYEES